MRSGPAGDDDASTPRAHLVSTAVRLSYLSVGWGLVSGTWAIVAGLLAGSLGVLGLGLNVMADVVGSVTLIWRFRVEQSAGDAERAERRAAVVIACALGFEALFLLVQSVRHLATHAVSSESLAALLAAAASVVVLVPLGLTKRKVGAALDSRALQGDGSLSLIGAGLAALALLGLLLVHGLGWWWADPAVGLLIAGVAGTEGWRVFLARGSLES